ncbi:MAG: hypothetical protein M3176_12960 [Chloroflexota bacterium]|nr:hypothetical protein [Chloroflexota bacterium]
MSMCLGGGRQSAVAITPGLMALTKNVVATSAATRRSMAFVLIGRAACTAGQIAMVWLGHQGQLWKSGIGTHACMSWPVIGMIASCAGVAITN